jgi:RNA polymerase sigma factor for flagellar operon FliA
MSERLTPEQSALVERVAPRVTIIARAVGRTLRHIPLGDLESAGNEALVRAATRYDPEAGVPFANFAYYRIRGAMLDAARAHSPGSRQVRRAQLRLEASQALLEQEARKGGAQQEHLAKRVATARSIFEKHAQAVMLSRSAPVEPDEVADASIDPERELIERERACYFDRVYEQLDPEERELVDALYRRGISMREYGEEKSTSTSTISRRHARLIARLAEWARGQPK